MSSRPHGSTDEWYNLVRVEELDPFFEEGTDSDMESLRAFHEACLEAQGIAMDETEYRWGSTLMHVREAARRRYRQRKQAQPRDRSSEDPSHSPTDVDAVIQRARRGVSIERATVFPGSWTIRTNLPRAVCNRIRGRSSDQRSREADLGLEFLTRLS